MRRDESRDPYHRLAFNLCAVALADRLKISLLQAIRDILMSPEGSIETWYAVAKTVDERAVAAYAAAGIALPEAKPLKRTRGRVDEPSREIWGGVLSLAHGVGSAWLAWRLGISVTTASAMIVGIPPRLDDWWYGIAQELKDSAPPIRYYQSEPKGITADPLAGLL